jgi:3-oxoadipate enol-lactonase/4-carboxymuconolactone decarboxylase
MNSNSSEIQRLQRVLLGGRIVRGWRVEGPAPTWLLVPPLGVSAAIWMPLLRELHGKQAAVAVDLAGFGSSEVGKSDPSYADQRALLTAYLDALHGSLVMVACSTSVPLCLELARREEHRTDALIVSGFGTLQDPEAWITKVQNASSFAETLLSGHELASSEANEREQLQKNLVKPAYVSFFDRELRSVLRAGFADVAVPTLLIAGRSDPYVNSAEVEKSAATLASVRVQWVDGSGQLAAAQRPRELLTQAHELLEPMRASA